MLTHHTVGVLAVQGAFIEHERRLEELGAHCVELRQARDLDQPFDRLVLPGGESTVQAKLLRELEMFEPLRQRINDGMPVLGTCAGLILLASSVEGQPGSCPGFGTLPITVRRNAYGRQLGSFRTEGSFMGGISIPMTFIRAPQIVEVGPEVEVLSWVENTPAAVRCGNQVACAFHPELDPDPRLHELFLGL